ncbi:DUF6678 family protein [Hymenobacter saemangeumensis]|uniref:DUF6678 family protein n=1 Tax=Hymenobacter saemangeumensis TaxID=1084522 RepID=UPI003CD07549
MLARAWVHRAEWPLAIWEVEWLEINPNVVQRQGRLMPPKQLCYLEEITLLLQAESWPYTIDEKIVRVPFAMLGY